MRPSNLQAVWSETDSLATLTYQNDLASAFALIRLHEPGETPAGLSFDVDGDVLLCNQCNLEGQDPHRWSVEQYSVLIGYGTVSRVPQ